MIKSGIVLSLLLSSLLLLYDVDSYSKLGHIIGYKQKQVIYKNYTIIEPKTAKKRVSKRTQF